MKKKIRFNLLDAAILLVAAGLLLSFVFRAEISRFVSGCLERAEYTVAFTVVTTPDNADALTVGARLTDGDGAVYTGEVTVLSPAEGFGALAGQRALAVEADMHGYTKDGRALSCRRHPVGAGRFVHRDGGWSGTVRTDRFRS